MSRSTQMIGQLKVTEYSEEEAEALRVIPELWNKGCGANIGGKPCDAPLTEPLLLAVNGPMTFLLWRVLHVAPGRAGYCFLCDRHQGSVRAATQDMPPALIARQRHEAREYARHLGLPDIEPGAVAGVDVSELVSPLP